MQQNALHWPMRRGQLEEEGAAFLPEASEFQQTALRLLCSVDGEETVNLWARPPLHLNVRFPVLQLTLGMRVQRHGLIPSKCVRRRYPAQYGITH
jgi:hypothetical protein